MGSFAGLLCGGIHVWVDGIWRGSTGAGPLRYSGTLSSIAQAASCPPSLTHSLSACLAPVACAKALRAGGV